MKKQFLLAMLFTLSLGVLCFSVAGSQKDAKPKMESYSFEPGVPVSPVTVPAVKAIAFVRPSLDSRLIGSAGRRKSGKKKITFSEDVRRRLRESG